MMGLDEETSMMPANPYCPHTYVPDHIRVPEEQDEMIKQNPPEEVKGFSCYMETCDLGAKARTSQCDPLLVLDGQKILKCPCCSKLDVANLADLKQGKICEKDNHYYMMPIGRILPRIEDVS